VKTYGLIGVPLSHSFSAKYFADKFAREGITDCVYKNFSLESIEALPSLIDSENLSGLNVTIPYKESVIQYLDELDPTAQAIGAVNCIKITDGKLTGYNTDAYGFRESLKKYLDGSRLKALILGTGGSSKAVAFALAELGIPYTIVSRRQKAGLLTYQGLTDNVIAAHKLIINSTPIGMYPVADAAPDLPYGAVTNGHYLYDLIYNPGETAFLRQGRLHGSHIKNGLEMLGLQAEKNWEIWLSRAR
jgi:shikimate dehydrogenase